MKNMYIVLILIVVTLLGGYLFFNNQNKTSTRPSPSPIVKKSDTLETAKSGPSETPKQTKMQKPELTINKNKKYEVTLKTSEGDIKISLTADKTPITVNNFVYLARAKFYDNTIFHRVIKGFMIQGGDPTGTGSGGPGYQFDDEPFSGKYTRGTVAMANAGQDTNGSQFFIMHADMDLQPDYVIFGKVISGMDVVDKIATAPVSAGPRGEGSTPVNPVKILSTEVIEE